MTNDFYRQLGMGVSSLTFGVALSIFIYAAATNVATTIQAWILFGASFFLMLRLWWRYNELFVQQLPSNTYWHFLLDFAVSFFGILAVLSVSDIQKWAVFGIMSMLSSAARCALSWKGAGNAMPKLIKTLCGAAGMLAVFAAAYYISPFVDSVMLAGVVFLIVLVFTIYSSLKP